jgi:hypothetical protein
VVVVVLEVEPRDVVEVLVGVGGMPQVLPQVDWAPRVKEIMVDQELTQPQSMELGVVEEQVNLVLMEHQPLVVMVETVYLILFLDIQLTMLVGVELVHMMVVLMELVDLVVVVMDSNWQLMPEYPTPEVVGVVQVIQSQQGVMVAQAL